MAKTKGISELKAQQANMDGAITRAVLETDAVTTTATVVLYGLGKKPRNGLNEGTKHGVKGTAGTYLAICKMLADKNGSADMAAIQAVCAEQNDKGFARYAVRNHWLQPIVAK
jgi:hypothetical protein